MLFRSVELLLEVTQRMASFSALDEVLRSLVDMTTTELNAERGSLFLNDADTSELYSRVAQGNIQRETEVRQAIAHAAGEINQLKTTLGVLRDELEQAQADKRKAVQQELVSAALEMQQLRSTAAALRDGLELSTLDKENAIRHERSLFADESVQMRDTIQSLRAQFEDALRGRN